MAKTSRPAEASVQSKTTKSPKSLATIARKRNTRSTANLPTGSVENNNANNTQSSAVASDMSDDECDKTPTKPSNVRRSSMVHDYATKTSPNEYVCSFCTKTIRCGLQTNSNIRRHLANVHGKTQLLSKSHRLSPVIHIAPKKKKQLDEAAIRAIIMDARPFGDYRRPGMQSFLKVAVPGYYGPSSRTVQRNLSKLYVEKQQELKAELANVSDISITADLWKSPRNRCFLCITSHYIKSTNYESCSKVLSFRHFRGRHFGIRIRSHIHRVLKQFDLIGKITATTTDNGSDIKNATGISHIFGVRFHCIAHGLNLMVHRALGLWPKKNKKVPKSSSPSQFDQDEEQLWEDEVESDDDNDDDEQLGFANNVLDNTGDDIDGDDNDEDDENHELTLIPDDDISDSDSDSSDTCHNDLNHPLKIGELLHKCRIIITTIRKSSILQEAVRNTSHDFQPYVDLILDMRIRWNSSYKMIDRLLSLQSVLKEFYAQIDSLSGITKQQHAKLMRVYLSNDDWALLESLRYVLERISEATDLVSGKNYPTLPMAYAVKLSIEHFVNDLTGDSNIRRIKKMLQAEFNRYMTYPVDSKEANMIYAAALLDPCTHDVMKPDDKKAAEKFLALEVKRRLKDNPTGCNSLSTTSSASDAGESESSGSSAPNKRAIQIRKLFSKCGIHCSTVATNTKKTLTIYQELAKLASIRKDDYEFSTFWQEYGNSMPNLVILARKYLAISATSVPAESAFSVSSYVMRKNRLGLTSRNVKYTMFLKDKLN